MTATLTVTQRRSSNGCNRRQLDTLRSLGLRRIGHTIEITDNAQARGMVHAVRHIVELTEPPAGSSRKRASAGSVSAPASEAGASVDTQSPSPKRSAPQKPKAADHSAAKAADKAAAKTADKAAAKTADPTAKAAEKAAAKAADKPAAKAADKAAAKTADKAVAKTADKAVAKTDDKPAAKAAAKPAKDKPEVKKRAPAKPSDGDREPA
ncbi:MAG TPA: 50S ribosomal protein L30 [Solirubrobacteraceae bacterium]|nr:50S ribosomal protein L30 [Solirubrobacteraceae bacterium]